MKTLNANDQVKVAGASWVNRIFVGTMKDFYEGDSAKVLLALARGHDYAWTCNPGCSITSDYPGKDEKIAREKAAFEAAPELADGEVVLIDGLEFRVRILGLHYSDPIRFVPVI